MLAGALIPLLNHLIDQSGWAAARLQPYSGQQLRLALGGLALDLGIADDGRFCAADPAGEISVSISLPTEALLTLASDPAKAMAQARLEGSAELAEAVGFVFRHLRWDAEEDLARLVGDIAAYRLVRTGQSALNWAKEIKERSLENASEYLAEEARLLVPAHAQQHFSRDLLTLRDDLARLEKRIKHLEKPGA